MTKDDVICMADLADCHADGLQFVGKLNGKTWREVRDNYLAVLIAKAEREQIAEMVSNCDPRATPKGIAAAIRARGQG
jgi:hypothetical protein